MYSAEFWLNKTASPSTILDASAIAKFNHENQQCLPDFLFDLTQYPAYVPAETVYQQIQAYAFPNDTLYHCGQPLTADYYQALSELMNLADLQGLVQVKYAYTIQRTNIRSHPTADFVVKHPDDKEFDRFQEAVLDPAEPLIVLHYSADHNWCFVQASNYHGWVLTTLIAVTTDRLQWQAYSQMADFLVVTASHLKLSEEPHLPHFSDINFAMGAKLPLLSEQFAPAIVGRRSTAGCYVVFLPLRTADGTLEFAPALVPKSADVNKGYLPFSRANLLHQAFKLQGERYGWGGLFGSRDCSAVIMDIYRSVGIHLARNANQQATGAGTIIDLTTLTAIECRATLQTLAPGTLLYFPGHVMFFLGEYQQQFYALHAIAECGAQNNPQADKTLAPLPLNGIMVTSLNIPRTNGRSLFESLTHAICIP